jgi:hypothetical protein
VLKKVFEGHGFIRMRLKNGLRAGSLIVTLQEVVSVSLECCDTRPPHGREAEIEDYPSGSYYHGNLHVQVGGCVSRVVGSALAATIARIGERVIVTL